MDTPHYDLLVMGTGPAGQQAAIQAAKLQKRAAIVEQRDVVGGVCINTGTIPSKTLREAVLFLTGYHQRHVYGAGYAVKHGITMDDLLRHAHYVMRKEIEVVGSQMARHRIDVLRGIARFRDAHTIDIHTSGGVQPVSADAVVIAVGTRPSRPASVCFMAQKIIDSDGLLQLRQVPAALTVVGGGVIGAEYATIFAALGAQVTLIDGRPRLLDFVDDEIVEALQYHFRNNGGTLRLGERVAAVACPRDEQSPVVAELESGKRVTSDCLLYAAGRVGATADLQLDRVGIPTDGSGRIAVNERFQTAVPHIFAAGDVIGFPSLASTALEQGRRAACHAFGVDAPPMPPTFPIGIYTIPEISMVGRTEAQLTAAAIPYEVGIARYREIARGVILGDQTGMLKLLFAADDRRLLGVHALGQGATESVHIGQAVMAFGGGLAYFTENVFNYPTLAECYRVAAIDAESRFAQNRPGGM